ncbi:MAG TPA: winged helix-turn-helix domain-containing protein [Bryobacteraceae bacterium]|nr:winged helix-turn-helix domain-containing protein [Bryobacteraceae bacterium]
MAPSGARVRAYRFGPFRLDVTHRILERDNERVPLTPKVIDTLFVLVENAREIVTKETLISSVWPDVTVIESGLTRNISVLRKALEEGVDEGTYLETIPKRGYRFVAEVTPELEPQAEAQPQSPPPPPPVDALPDKTKAPPRFPSAAAAIILGLASIGGYLLYSRTSHQKPPAPVVPGVRIGQHLLYKLSPEEALRACDEYRQAIAMADSASARAGLALALLQTATLGARQVNDISAEAEQAAKKSLELDPTLPLAHYAKGLLSLLSHWDFERAEQGFDQTLRLDETSTQARFGYVQLKYAQGELRQAISLAEEALRLDPASPYLGARYCQTFYYARDYRRAESECRKVLDRERHFTIGRYYLALSLGWLGQIDEARRILDQAAMSSAVLEVDRAWLSLRAGDKAPAMQALARRRALIREGKLDSSANLLLAAMLDDRDEAFAAIEAGIRRRAIEMLTLNIDPRLEPLRSDKRYNEALQRIGLKPPH